MIKRFCNECEVEILKAQEFSHKEIKLAESTLLTVSVDCHLVGYDICKYCVLKIINAQLDDRPTMG